MNIKRILLVIWVILIGITVYFLYTYDVTPVTLREYFAALGPWAAVAYIVAYTVRPIVFFPAAIMTPLSAVLFGPLYGWVLSFIGGILSAIVAFFIGRYFSKSIFKNQNKPTENQNKFAQFITKYKEKLEQNGFETVLFLRIVPLFPFDFVNYASGLSNIQFRTYFLATVIGIIPGLTAFIFLGGSITNPYFLIPTVLTFTALTLGARYLKKRKGDQTSTNT